MTGRLRNMTAMYITSGHQMLMLYRVGSKVVAPSWCGIGGHFEKNELNDARACVLRELNEETGLTEANLENIRLRYVTLRLKNGEIRQNYYFFADLREDVEKNLTCNEGQLAWINLDDVLDREMPVSAKFMLEHYLSTGIHNDVLYCGATEENGISFFPLNEF